MAQRWRKDDVVADRYRLEEVVGRGGMGTVWSATDAQLGHALAVKLLERDAERPQAQERFLREARACAAIGGRHVAEIFDFGVERASPFIAMELLRGESLGARLAREQRLSRADTVRVLSEVASAIDRAHRLHIVHRDLKPSNLYLAVDGAPRHASGDDGASPPTKEVVKVLDFGIAKILDGDLAGPNLTTTGSILGTAHYMSPEQARGSELDHRSDLWSLAILTIQCLTGELPIQGASMVDIVLAIVRQPIRPPRAIDPGLPAAVDAWFARATRRSPDERFDSAGEMAEELARALADG